MSAGGYTHLIIAGHPTVTGQLLNKLPKHLAAKIIDVVTASGKTPVSEIVDATIASFIETEENESRAVVETLAHEICTGGLAVVGTGPSFRALRHGQADMVLIASAYAPAPGWACVACDMMDANGERPPICPECGATELREFDVKEEMARLAAQYSSSVEVVNQAEPLMRFGGVGCLLRYRTSD